MIINLLNTINNKFIEFIKLKLSSKRFFLHIITMIIFIYLSSLLLVIIAMNIQIKNNLHAAKEESISTITHNASILEEIMDSIETQVFYFINNTQLQNFVKSNFFHENVNLSLEVARQISFFKNNNDLLQEICVYSKNMNGIYSNQLGFVRGTNNQLFDDFRQVESLPKRCGWVRSAVDNEIIHYWKLLGANNNICDGIIIFYVSEKKLLSQSLAASEKFSDSVSYVLSEEHEILMRNYGSLSDHINMNLLDSYVSDNLDIGKKASYFEADIDNVKMMIFAIKGVSGRTYMSILEKDLLLSVIYKNTGIFLVILLLTVVVCTVFSVFWSSQVYSPIKSLVMQCSSIGIKEYGKNNEITYISECFESLKNKVRSLNEYLYEMQSNLQDDLLVTLLEEPHPLNSEFYKKCDTYSLPVDHQYVVLAVYPITVYSVEMLKDLLTNTVFTSKIEDQHILINGSDHVPIVISFSASANSQKIATTSQLYASEIIAQCKANGIEVYVGISDICCQLNNLCYSYRNALINALEFTHDKNKRIFFGSVTESGIKSSTVTLIHGCIQAVKGCLEKSDTTAAIEKLNKFIDELNSTESVNYRLKAFKLLLSNLILIKYNCIDNSISNILDQNDLNHLDNCKSIFEARNWFFSTVIPLFTRSTPNLEDAYQKIVPTVCAYIHENILKDITLVSCADFAGVSPSYLSKIFKKEMQISFIDYVINCKVRYVQKLLLSTDMSINAIAQKIGYSPRNLYRVFFKVTGMSPNEFRQTKHERDGEAAIKVRLY